MKSQDIPIKQAVGVIHKTANLFGLIIQPLERENVLIRG